MNRVVAFAAILIGAACATSVMAQYCGEGSVARVVQVKFTADCGEVPDDVSVHIDSNTGPLLSLTKSPTGYWEADLPAFEPVKQTLCSHTCNSASGCARFPQIVAIDRGSRQGMCAARYVIRCTAQAWNVHVETEPGRWFIFYKRRLPGSKAVLQQGGKMAPFDLCDLVYDEQVELRLQGRTFSIPLTLIQVHSFERSQTIKVTRDELARKLRTERGTPLTDDERDLLPNLVTFKIMDR